MASLPWSPWPPSNRTELLSPAQIERILQMHTESKQNAVIYVLVVLVVYFVALAILVGRYLHNERDHDTLVCIGQAIERCVGACCRSAGHPPVNGLANGGAPAKQDVQSAAAGVPPPAGSKGISKGGGQRKVSLHLPSRAPPLLNLPKIRRPQPHTDSSSASSTSSNGSTPSPPAPPLRPGLGLPGQPGLHPLNGPRRGSSASSSDGADSQRSEARSVDYPLDTLTVYTTGDCCAEGRSSPAVVSIMVCDLQDTQV